MPGIIRRILAAVGLGRDLTTRYLEFYFPSADRTHYEVAHDWGTLLITMGGAPDEDVHEDSRPYLGYVVHRPVPDDPADRGERPTFLVTPAGEVWRHLESGEIPASTTRQEVTETRTEGGRSVRTTTLTSAAEPVIDHFLAHPEAWVRHGALERTGDRYRLRR